MLLRDHIEGAMMSNGRIKSVSPSVGRAPQEEPWVPDAGSNTALMMSGAVVASTFGETDSAWGVDRYGNS